MIDTKELRRLAQAATPGPWINHGRQPNVAGLPHSAVAAKTLLARVYSETYGDVEQETANASFITAANPAAISELLDRLEAAEKERDALRALVDILRSEISALRAKIEQMERQEPVAFGLCSGWALKATYIKEHEACEQRDRRQLTADLSGSLEAYRVSPLYALPGAQPAQSVPDGVAEALQRLIENGAALGPASSEDALLVARYRQCLMACAPSVPECPYPCGWRNLLKLAIEDGAYLARSINTDEPVTENARAVTTRIVLVLRDVLMAINNAAPEAKQ